VKNAQRMDEAWEWDRKNPHPDPEVFRREILPLIKAVPLGRIAAATGVSKQFASRVRRGDSTPHPRHWEALRSASPRPE